MSPRVSFSAPLLMRKNGSLRDIAIFHGPIRNCTRARQDICRQWERRHDMRFGPLATSCGAPRFGRNARSIKTSTPQRSCRTCVFFSK